MKHILSDELKKVATVQGVEASDDFAKTTAVLNSKITVRGWIMAVGFFFACKTNISNSMPCQYVNIWDTVPGVPETSFSG